MKHLLSTEEDVTYFGDCENAGPMDDMVGLLAVLCVDCKLYDTKDWSQFFLLRTVSRWWSRVINASLIANQIREMNLLIVKNPNCSYWFNDKCSFPSLHTLVIDSKHPLASRIPQMTSLRSLAIDGWLPVIKNMEKLERLAVIDMHDHFFVKADKLRVLPPRNLKTLVLMNQWLEYSPLIIPSELPHLRRLVLTIGAYAHEQDHYGELMRAWLPQLEEFRWYVTYFESYEKTLSDFLCGKF
jgi:hypothetical protein